MHYVYLLKAQKSDWIYIGYTSNLKQRIEDHKAKKNLTTSRLGPMSLACYEAYTSSEDAKEREKQLKQYGAALGHLKHRARRSLKSIGSGADLSGSAEESAGFDTEQQNLRGKEDVGPGKNQT